MVSPQANNIDAIPKPKYPALTIKYFRLDVIWIQGWYCLLEIKEKKLNCNLSFLC